MMMQPLFIVIILLSLSIFQAGCGSSAKPFRKQVYSSLAIADSVKTLKTLLAANPDDAQIRFRLGKLLLKEYYPVEAIAELRQAIKLDSLNIPAYLFLSSALQQQRFPDLNQAALTLKLALTFAPKQADVHLNLAQIYQEQGREPKAIEEFQLAVELAKDEITLVSAYLGLASLYSKLGDRSKAEAELEKARQIYPSVDELMRKIEIDQQITPPSKYAGNEFIPNDGVHPPLEDRIERILEEIKKQKEKKK